MGKKNKPARQNQVPKNSFHSEAIASNAADKKYFIWLGFILLGSLIAYLPVLSNGFIAWDDDTYINTNKLIHSIHLKEIFSTYVKGNYHPMTILVYAIEYRFFGLNETGYHACNLILHLLNTILVFYLLYKISNKMEVALVACLLFGIHPIHVESVAWAAELKDLLYTFFFLASCYFYLNYIDTRRRKYYVFALLLFVASLLSKAMAASLPVIFILIDYFKNRKFEMKAVWEKLPFFALSLIFGIVAVIAQKSAGATDVIYFTFLQRVAFASYSFFMYLYKIILPIQLSGYYPFPMKNGEYVTAPYYAFILLLFIFIGALFYSLRYSNKLFFSIGFFAITIFLVLQLFPVGGAMMADRYAYIPSIGIFYLCGEGFYIVWNKVNKQIVITLLILISIAIAFITNSRCQVWKDTMTFWSDVIAKYQNVPPAYYGRGVEYVNQKKFDEALNDFNKAISLKPDFVNAYMSRGIALFNQKKYEEALKDFDKSIQLNPDYELVYTNRGKVLMSLSRFDESLKDFNKSIELKPRNPDVYYNRATLFQYQGKKEAACNDFKKAAGLGSQAALDAIPKICN